MKVLVTAASKHGATAEIADALTAALREHGIDAEQQPPERVTSLADVDAVVLGSAVYAGRWLGTARHLAQRHYAALRARPVWLFSSGPIGEPLAPTAEPEDGAHFQRALGAREHRVFAGRLDPDDLGWVERTITGMLKAPSGDFRDWHAIRGWAEEVALALRREPVHG